MLFDPKESLSFNGNTGPYLQYMGARISSMLRKRDRGSGNSDKEGKFALANLAGDINSDVYKLLVSDSEWELVKTLAGYPEAVSEAAAGLDPSRLTGYLYDLSKCFSRFYHECPVLNPENPELSAARLGLSNAVLRVLKDAFQLTCIPFLETM